MFKTLTLRFKLILSFLLVAALIAGVSIYQLQSTKHLNNSITNLVDQDFVRLNALDDIRLTSAHLQKQAWQYRQDIASGDKASAAAVKAQLAQTAGIIRQDAAHYSSLAQGGKRFVSSSQVSRINMAVSDVADKSVTIADTAATASQQTLNSLQNDLSTSQDTLDSAVNTAISAEQRGVAQDDSDLDNTVRDLLNATVALAFATVLLAVGMGLFMASWITRAVTRLREGAERIANGDFSRPVRVGTGDEIGQVADAFNRMAARLKEAYQRQAAGQQRDEAMLQSMGEGMIATDELGKIVLINPVAVRYFGISGQAAVVGQPVDNAYKLYDAADKAAKNPLTPEERPVYRVLQSGVKVSDVFGAPGGDGKLHLINITATPVKQGERTIGVITVLRDVTHEKEVDRMKTEFISLASHQLRTPLSAIKWYSEMLVAGDAGQLKEEQLDFASNIMASTERMIALVNALLNISRIESGRIMVDPKPTDLGELVGGIVADLKAKIEEKQQHLIISVHDQLPKINLDPRLIGQVYLNLLTNAIKYTPKGGEISVFVSRKGEDIISQVTDNGYGIPKGQQDRLFQKFFRASNAVKVETDGTGLGLYLIKAVIESSGGKIWFKSEEGKGSTFWFSIPLSGMKRKEGEVTLDV
jgi:PAS domain S-box-containing protein